MGRCLMSQKLISLSPDLARLQGDGYDIDARQDGYLVVKIPYVDSAKKVKWGILVSELTLAGDVTTKPSTHVVHFGGDYPCRKDGSPITEIQHQSQTSHLAPDLVVNHSFSSKPSEGYKDYYEKMTTYCAIISSHAQATDPTATPKTYPVAPPDDEDSVFNYADTASSRAGIGAINAKLALRRVAIVGLGGTGSYLLDLLVKAPPKEIHLFDGDRFLQHNAFRSPGGPSVDEIKGAPMKVTLFRERYSPMRRNIFAHDIFIDASNVHQLKEMDFVFLCLEGQAKRLIIEKLQEFDVPFIDVGMGVYTVEGCLAGVLRVTSSTLRPGTHLMVPDRIPSPEGDTDDVYSQNIQIADLNALNAVLAVVKWKKQFGFYLDLEGEHHTTYTVDGNTLTNEDRSESTHEPSPRVC
jgi:hypothetical protein